MIFDWYQVINQAEFEADSIPSRSVQLVLEGVGLKTILVVKGLMVSLVYDGVMLSPGLGGENPFVFGGYAAYLDANGELWLGIPTT